jgi:hypothetical protein
MRSRTRNGPVDEDALRAQRRWPPRSTSTVDHEPHRPPAEASARREQTGVGEPDVVATASIVLTAVIIAARGHLPHVQRTEQELGSQDSNLVMDFQRVPCCRYTTPQ